MGLINFIKGQFIEVIEWTDSSADTIVYRFPVANKEIKMGAQLTVRESQVAIFINEGQLADVFEPGRYELTTENLVGRAGDKRDIFIRALQNIKCSIPDNVYERVRLVLYACNEDLSRFLVVMVFLKLLMI